MSDPVAVEKSLGEQVIETLHHHLENSTEIHFGPHVLDLDKTVNEPVALLTGGRWEDTINEHGATAQEIVGGFHPCVSKHVVMMLLAAGVVAVAAIAAARSATRSSGRGFFGHAVESTFLFLRDEVVMPNVGAHHGRAYMPWFATFFFFILACNLIGLLPPPLGATATGNINVTLALALLTFLAVQIGGMMEKGILGYWVGLVPHGVPWWMWPLVFAIELVGLLTKPFALTVRLFANMTAGHVILGVLTVFLVSAQGLGMQLLVSPPSLVFAVGMLTFEILVAFVQAYIFTMLSSIFVGLALSHEH